MTHRPTRRLLALALAAALSGTTLAQNIGAFRVQDIRVDGLQRISTGTVFSYLPVERGETLDQDRAGESIRALFRTGFFSDVSLAREGDILVIKVVERPAINAITLSGNRDIKTEELLKGLRGIGLAEGETYNPLNVDRVTQELIRQYNNRGKYSVTITPTVTNLPLNRVDVAIAIDEGKAARIRDINIVGNRAFSETELREGWESNTSNWLSWYRRDDQYSREKLSGDLEKLTNFYLDRGYVDFNVESTQVAISPDRRDMTIGASVSEGEVYSISSVQVSGDTVLPVEEVEAMLFVREGQTFSRQLLELTSDGITAVLGNIGYAFAEVNPVPEIDREKNEVAINFVVNPGPRVQVRRIIFKGNDTTADEVLRREFRQFEGTWYSQAAIDRSKIRLQRLGHFDEVEIETPAVAGEPDKVDVVVSVKERQFGQFQFGLGFSQVFGLTVQLSLSQNNFLGSGNRVSMSVQRNSFSRGMSFSFLDPYFTDDGISVGYNLSYSENDFSDFNIANFSTDNVAAEAVFGLPLSETDSISASLGIDRIDLNTVDGQTPPELIGYLVQALGDRARFAGAPGDTPDPFPCLDLDNDPATPDCIVQQVAFSRLWTVNAWRGQIGWARDTRNDFFAPTAGMFNRVGAEIALPGSDLEYFKISYDFSKFWPITRALVVETRASLGYGDSYGATGDAGLPFFENFYAGGPGSLRGFEQNTLGPISSLDFGNTDFRQSLGGAFKAIGSVEAYFPTLLDARGTRISAFMDFGNVWRDVREFGSGDLRVSTGLALQWQSPMGPISISWAAPLRSEERDRIERLQFTFGGQF
ncbi:MAG TPA: outer membrane protein assembly factor BamA [Xanthomonadaceae bacterium]|jgi:outer membrane protein insertion porin family|nr:outer membrane protein assembly factor BamA [Xanthomonadaceae bacterium]